MREIDAITAESYLRATGHIADGVGVRIRELTGGVSNVVLLVEPEHEPAYVLKQARPRLRVAQPWFCSVERIWREAEVLRVCRRVLREAGSASSADFRAEVPELLFEDRQNFLYAMSAAPPHTVWKTELLSGVYRVELATACGRLLGLLHAGTWRDREIAATLGDRQFFIALRIDPYYRRVAEVHPALRERVEALIASQDEQRCCLVHGDFSPKNLLVHDANLTLVDFEVGHYGDPAFDLGFLLSHLVLKSIHAASACERLLELTQRFFAAYRGGFTDAASQAELGAVESRAVANCAACVLARVDGKSPVEYLSDAHRETARRLGLEMLRATPASWSEFIDATGSRLRR
ncbi:MAG: phosphotransferase [Pirellulaceae bacterium]